MSSNMEQWNTYGQGDTYHQGQGARYSNNQSPASSFFYPTDPSQKPPQFPSGGDISKLASSEYLAHPIANVAVHYGSKLVDSGKEIVDKEINKYVPVSRLKHFFSVDTQYVSKKLRLLVFPFLNQEWSLKYVQNKPPEPRHDFNAPDLYIPLMAFVTYILLTGVLLGIQNRFSPEVLGIISSTALAWTFIEVFIQFVVLYIMNIPTSLTILDLTAYSGYKFVGLIICIFLGLVFDFRGYMVGLVYCCVSHAFFSIRSVKWRLMGTSDTTWDEGFNTPSETLYTTRGNKRKMYFLLSIAVFQVFQIWWLSADVKS